MERLWHRSGHQLVPEEEPPMTESGLGSALTVQAPIIIFVIHKVASKDVLLGTRNMLLYYTATSSPRDVGRHITHLYRRRGRAAPDSGFREVFGTKGVRSELP